MQANPEAIEHFIDQVRSALADVLNPIAHLQDMRDVPSTMLVSTVSFERAVQLAEPGQLYAWNPPPGKDPYAYTAYLHRTHVRHFPITLGVDHTGAITFRKHH